MCVSRPMVYIDYIEPKYRDVAPRIVEQPDGTDAFVVHGMKRPIPWDLLMGPASRSQTQ